MTLIIDRIKAIEIIDSRGKPTVETEVTLASGAVGRAGIPSGASTGKHEAVERRDEDSNRYGGFGVLQAIENVNNIISNAVIGGTIHSQEELDKKLCTLDGTLNKGKLGANAILSVSLAFAVAAAAEQKLWLFQYIGHNSASFSMPKLMMNIFSGGAHADNCLAIQEFMVVPQAELHSKNLQMGCEIYHMLKSILRKRKLNTNVGDEGGFASAGVDSVQAVFELILQAIEASGYKAGKDVMLALDVAANEVYEPAKKSYQLLTDGEYSAKELVGFYIKLCRDYPIISIEDGMAEDDFAGWKYLRGSLTKDVQLVGDDLFVTNSQRLTYGVENKLADAILIKPNQVGSISETIETTLLARKHNFNAVMSHRSGETEDTAIADLAVGFNCEYIKIGAPARVDRTAKYNQLTRIAHKLNLI